MRTGDPFVAANVTSPALVVRRIGATNITLSGELDAATLDISGNADIDGTLETDALSLNGTAVTSTAAELNVMDGGTSASNITIVDADRFVVNDNGTMKQVAATKVAAYTAPSTDAGAVGTYVLAKRNNLGGSISFGSTYAGNTLRPTGVDPNGVSNVGSFLTGTWRAMGHSDAIQGYHPVILFVRVS